MITQGMPKSLNLIDLDDPTRRWQITITDDGRITKMTEKGLSGQMEELRLIEEEIKVICKAEGLDDKWKIKMGSNFCDKETRTVYWSWENMGMFLHELAHALIPRETDIKMGDQTGHHSIWGDKFTYLVDKYMGKGGLPLAHLAKVTDEELIQKLEPLRCRFCESWWGGQCHSENLRQAHCGESLAKDILSIITPILSARHQKELQEAVANAREQGYIKGLGTTDAKAIEQARIEERKAIGQIFKAYDEYVQLLGDELNELVGMAVAHNWKSHRYDAGEKCREAIKTIKAKFGKFPCSEQPIKFPWPEIPDGEGIAQPKMKRKLPIKYCTSCRPYCNARIKIKGRSKCCRYGWCEWANPEQPREK